MKSISVILLLLIVLVSGCTAIETSAPISGQTGVSAPATPDLTGTWTGTMKGYDNGIGFNDHPSGVVNIIVNGQRDRIFSGRITITENNVTIVSENIAGAISRDGKTVTVVEESGYCSGTVINGNELELVYMNDNPPFSIAIDSLQRE